MTAAIARCTTPFSGPSQRSCESDASRRYVPPRSPDDVGDVPADEAIRVDARRRRAQLVAAADREGEAVPRSTVRRRLVGGQDDVGGRVVGILVHRVGAVGGDGRREAQVVDLDAGDACS